jgi:hypothetical protein
MEIKILCGCGAKFKFDVEPVNGRSPGAVHCPACGKDSTEATNALIQERLNSQAPAAGAVAATATATPRISVGAPNPSAAAAAAVRIPTPSPAPLSTAPASAPAQGSVNPKMAFMPAPATGGTSLSVAGHGKKEDAAPSATSTPAPPPIPASVPAARHPAAGKIPRAERPVGASFPKGVLGGTLGALVGAVIWYILAIYIIRLGILSMIATTGAVMGARALGKHGTEKLARTMAGITGLVIFVTQLAVLSGIKTEKYADAAEEAYKNRMELAELAAAAKSDDDIRKVMLEDPDAHVASADQIEADAIGKYRAGNLAVLQKFAKGDPSRVKFEEAERTKLSATDPGISVARMIWIGIWVIIGMSGAYKGITGKE